MKGTARPNSLTGKVQRALSDEWQTQAQISAKAGIYESKPATVRALLERLCSEGRAEWKVNRSLFSHVGVVQWRKPTGDARTSHRAAEGPQPPAGDDGNAGTPVALCTCPMGGPPWRNYETGELIYEHELGCPLSSTEGGR